jgi:hypothetical protein
LLPSDADFAVSIADQNKGYHIRSLQYASQRLGWLQWTLKSACIIALKEDFLHHFGAAHDLSEDTHSILDLSVAFEHLSTELRESREHCGMKEKIRKFKTRKSSASCTNEGGEGGSFRIWIERLAFHQQLPGIGEHSMYESMYV